jgi:N-hydroxyarylamine O-acetyltransferase
MDVRSYLDRIGYTGRLDATVNTLRGLHRQHMLSVPFENLDIHQGRRIVLDAERFVDKVVNRRRGGFCYELNGAFAALLTAAGFRVTLISARVSNKQGKLSPEFDHLALRVDLDEPWLADVGFGDSFLEPLRLMSHVGQCDPAGGFRLIPAGERWLLERLQPEGDWRPQYDFSLRPRRLSEFAARCRYHQTSPKSHFTRSRICSMARPGGRVTLSGLRLIMSSNGRKNERTLSGDAEWRSALQDHFGILEKEFTRRSKQENVVDLAT